MSQAREHDTCRSRRNQSEKRFIGEAYDLSEEEKVVIATPSINDIQASIEYGRTAELNEITDKVDVIIFVPSTKKLETVRSSGLDNDIELHRCENLSRTIVVRESLVYIENGALNESQSALVQTLSARVCDHQSDDLVEFTRKLVGWTEKLD